jgi:hypothetical protein
MHVPLMDACGASTLVMMLYSTTNKASLGQPEAAIIAQCWCTDAWPPPNVPSVTAFEDKTKCTSGISRQKIHCQTNACRQHIQLQLNLPPCRNPAERKDHCTTAAVRPRYAHLHIHPLEKRDCSTSVGQGYVRRDKHHHFKYNLSYGPMAACHFVSIHFSYCSCFS